MKKTISLIAAIGKNGELGKDNDLLWHLPIDFKWFIEHTKHKSIIMGRKTMDSLGKPLKNRVNIVLSRTGENIINGFARVGNWEEAFKIANQSESNEIMIIGGADIYKQSLDFADKLYLTFVNAAFEDADSYFPKMNPEDWRVEFSEIHEADTEHQYSFEFKILQRIIR